MRKYTISILLFLNVFSTLRGQDTISIAFIGDIMQHTKQLKAALIPGKDTLLPESYDYSSYFSRMDDIISGADYSVANLEFPCGLPPYSGYPSFSAPSSLPLEAKRSGIDLFLCANNHVFDKGTPGAVATMETYEKMGASYMGLYRDRKSMEENNPFFVTVKGIKIAFINFTYTSNGYSKEIFVNRMDSVMVKKYIEKAHSENADMIIALPHWGEEYSTGTTSGQRMWKRMLIRNGVSVIIGTHPHVIEPVEIDYGDEGEILSVTAYSLGNYISNMSILNTQLGMVFTIKLVKDIRGLTTIIDSHADYIWCALRGKLESNYTSFPVYNYLDKKDEFIVKEEYSKMKRTYMNLKEVIGYGK